MFSARACATSSDIPVKGLVARARPDHQRQPKSGKVEVLCHELVVLNLVSRRSARRREPR